MVSPLRFVGSLALVGLVLNLPAFAQTDPDYVISVSDANASQGGTITVDVGFDLFDSEIQGWSFGICHDSSQLALVDAVDSTLTQTIKNGSPPDFDSLDLYPGGGWSKGVIICFLGCATLAPGTDWVVNHATYDVLGAPGTTEISPCSTLGTPVVAVKVIVDGTTVSPVRVPGTVQIFPGTPPTIFELAGGTPSVLYDPANGQAQVDYPVRLEESTLSPDFPHQVTAFSFGVAHNPVHMTPTQVFIGSSLTGLAGGAGPDLFLTEITPVGVTVQCELPTAGPLVADVARTVASVRYQSNPSVLIFNPFGITSPVVFSTSVADPPVPNEVITDATLIVTDTAPGHVRFVPRERFMRGDANDDGSVDISDVLELLDDIFEGDVLACGDASDANDDDSVNIADAVHLLDYLFIGSVAIPAPFPSCSWDSTGTPSCLVYNTCL